MVQHEDAKVAEAMEQGSGAMMRTGTIAYK